MIVFSKSIFISTTIAAIFIVSFSVADKDDEFDEYLTEYIKNIDDLVLFLDYDGTLTDIVNDRDKAFLPEETKNVLERLAERNNLYIAIVSGRGLNDVKNMVDVDNITYAGSTGLNINFRDGNEFAVKMPEQYVDSYNRVIAMLSHEVCTDNANLEVKDILMTYHYRQVDPKIRPKLIKRAMEIVNKFEFEAVDVKCAIEIKPPINWDKGYAVLHILENVFGGNWKESTGAIYVGDDKNDEPAMRALRETGVTFRVDPDDTKPTEAHHHLASTAEVLALLKWLDKNFHK